MRNIAPQASIPEPAEAIVRRALARSRDDRYPTVEALARAIAEVQADGSARAVAGKTSAPGDLGPPAPLARSASPTFVSGPTAALEAPRQNSRTDPVSPHGLTELSAAEAVDTGETRHPTPRPTASEGRQPAPAPPREGMETAQIVVPIAPTPALMVATPPAPRGPRRTMWLLAGLGAPGIALALWLSRGTGVEPAPIPRPAASPVSSEQAKVMVPDLKAAEPVPIVTPEPEPEPAPSVMPEPEPAPVPILTPEPEPDPPKVPDKAAAPATSKPAVRYASRVTRALHILRGSASLADCFGTSTAPLLVDVEVGAATGAATVTLPALKRGSVLDICVQRVFQGTKFPVGGPGDADFESKKYVLNKQ
jgi:hypothetical protein